MTLLLISVAGLCVWDTIYTNKAFSTMHKESEYIYTTLLESNEIPDTMQQKTEKLNSYWTKKMDIISISISRKDLQPISDYLQYLHCSILNNNFEDSLTYSRLLFYNIEGVKEANGVNFLNLL